MDVTTATLSALRRSFVFCFFFLTYTFIVVNYLSHSHSQLMLMPVLDGKAILFSFLTSPEVRIGVAFGSGGSQSLPATELPGVSSMLVRF